MAKNWAEMNSNRISNAKRPPFENVGVAVNLEGFEA
jgi:hypothetical protein